MSSILPKKGNEKARLCRAECLTFSLDNNGPRIIPAQRDEADLASDGVAVYRYIQIFQEDLECALATMTGHRSVNRIGLPKNR
jgi:hypothetical protein